MKRAAIQPSAKPMRRSAIARKAPRKHKQKIGGFPYVRSRKLLDLFKSLPCQVTGAPGPSDPCHSNWGCHGKGAGIKASDVYVAALSREVHTELDQGSRWTQAEKQAIWWRAHVRSVQILVNSGQWPDDIPVPDIETYPF